MSTTATDKNLPPFNSSNPTKENLFYIRPGEPERRFVEVERDGSGKFKQLHCPLNPTRYLDVSIEEPSLLGKCADPFCQQSIQFFREPIQNNSSPKREARPSGVRKPGGVIPPKNEGGETTEIRTSMKLMEPTQPILQPSPDPVPESPPPPTTPGPLLESSPGVVQKSEALPVAEKEPQAQDRIENKKLDKAEKIIVPSEPSQTSPIPGEVKEPRGENQVESEEAKSEIRTLTTKHGDQVDFENFMNGAFIVSRSLFDSEVWFKSPLYRDIWLLLIGKASFRDVKDGDFVCHKGELYTTYAEIMEAVRFFQGHTKVKPSMQQVRDVLDWLVKQRMIEKVYVKPAQIPRRSPTAPRPLALVSPIRKASKEQTIKTDARTNLYRTGALRIKLINYEPYQTLQNYFDSRKNRPQNRPKEQTSKEAEEQGKNRVRIGVEQTPPRQPLAIKGSYPSKNDKNVKNKRIYAEGSDPLRLSTLLLGEIRKNKPDFKQPNLQAWARVFDLILRRDHRKPEAIERVIKWAQGDHGDGTGSWKGWASNILSPGKLREKFDELEMKMEATNGRESKSSW